MEKYNNILLMLYFLSLSSCSPKPLAPSDYIEWMTTKSNGLHLSKVVGDKQYELQYRTAEMVVLQELRSNNIDAVNFGEKYHSKSTLQYYNMKLYGPGGAAFISRKTTTPENYISQLAYYSSYAQEDMYVIQEGDTLPCVLFHLERYYDISPYNTLVLGFPLGENPMAERTLVFQDQLAKLGAIKFHFSTKTIQNIPQLKIPQE